MRYEGPGSGGGSWKPTGGNVGKAPRVDGADRASRRRVDLEAKPAIGRVELIKHGRPIGSDYLRC